MGNRRCLVYGEAAANIADADGAVSVGIDDDDGDDGDDDDDDDDGDGDGDAGGGAAVVAAADAADGRRYVVRAMVTMVVMRCLLVKGFIACQRNQLESSCDLAKKWWCDFIFYCFV